MITDSLMFLAATTAEVADAVGMTTVFEKFAGMTPEQVLHAVTALSVSIV